MKDLSLQKKAVIVGGSNGIGFSIAQKLSKKGYAVNILDKAKPAKEIANSSYTYCNLLDFSDDLFSGLAKDESIEVLMITAGFGRVCGFEFVHPAEIQNMMQVNSVAVMKIIRFFYERIKSKKAFYCGVMGSIAGLVSSPMFSVYAASKASLCRFIESVNIELEISGIKNRILNVSPGSIKGTKFNGGENDFSKTDGLASQIIEKLFASETLFIPEYDEVYKKVIKDYQSDSHAYGLHSYEYKLKSGRVRNERKVKIGYLSGTFDLFHVGHLNLLRRAKEQCDYLIVGVHKDASHKGKTTFIPFEERKAVVASCRYVDKVVESCREDSDAWNLWHYDRLFVGSDYKGTERFARYEKFFEDKNVEIVYFPYTNETSSTQLREIIDRDLRKKN